MSSIPYRIGFGTDIHRLESVSSSEEGGFYLGGVWVTAPFRIIAYSDGDVVWHAVTDALLGAIAEDDIGDLFPDTTAENRDRISIVFVQEALQRVRTSGYCVGNIDITIHLQTPKLATLKKVIRNQTASILGIAENCVSVKAKTSEGLDSIGNSEAISAEAVVLLYAAT